MNNKLTVRRDAFADVTSLSTDEIKEESFDLTSSEATLEMKWFISEFAGSLFGSGDAMVHEMEI